jgi:type II secretory pathway pseudopilin PulG
VNLASANSPRDTRTTGVDDEGFTLTEMVVALIIMFGALIASSQVVISMVKATLYSRHADFAVTLATQVMEDAVSNDCGGRLPDNRDNQLARWTAQRERCRFQPATATPDTTSSGPISRCKTGPTTYFPGWASDRLTESIGNGENNLGRRYFVKVVGPITYCVSFDVQWVPLGWTGSGTTNNMRLQRTVRVQWVEPNKKDTRRDRTYTQVAALPPDAVQSGNIGRFDINVGLSANSATIFVPVASGAASTIADPVLTLSADSNGWVHIPYIPTDWTTKTGSGPTDVSVSSSYTLDLLGGTTRVTPAPAFSLSQPEWCSTAVGAAPVARASTGVGITTC